METFKISAVIAAAEFCSFSKAAEAFSYTPSAFSHLVSAFEGELGVRLFDRSSSGVSLTAEGKALLPKFKAMLNCEKELRSTAAELVGQSEQELKICTYSSISRNILSGFLKKLREEFPHIHVSVHVVDTLDEWFENDRADLIFADDMAFGTRDWVPMMEDPFYVVAPKGFFGGRKAVTIEELYPHPYISTDDFNLDQFLDLAQFKECIHYKSIDDYSIINAVRDGLGITILPRMVLKGATEGVELIKLQPALQRTLGFWYNKKKLRKLQLTPLLLKEVL